MEYFLLVTHRASDAIGSSVDVAGLLESFGEWVEIEPSVYVLWTGVPRWEVYKRIRAVVREGDGLTVVRIPGSAFGHDGLPPLAAQADLRPEYSRNAA